MSGTLSDIRLSGNKGLPRDAPRLQAENAKPLQI